MFTVPNFPLISFSDKESDIIKLVGRAGKELGVKTYLVGGYVRDKILERSSKDMDFMCIGNGIALAEKVASYLSPSPVVAVFKNFGTARIMIDEVEIEFVGARKESYQTDSRKPDIETGSLEDDLNRRDFTINTLTIDILSDIEGELADTFGGLKDMERKIIRTPLDPDITFSDDPLRMMRAIRFAAQLSFEIHPATFNSIRHNKERIKIISAERITEELNKIILSPLPSKGFVLLKEAGILPIIFPELTALEGVEMKEGKGHKDNFYHTLQVLDNISLSTEDLWVRWAAILHDIAKPATKKFEPGHGWTFHGHDALGAKMVQRIFRRMRLPLNEKMKLVQELVFLHLRPISLSKENITDSAIRRLIFEAGDNIESLMMLCEADITSKNYEKVKKYRQNFELVKQRMKEVEEKDHIRNWQPPITGEIIMQAFNLKPCKQVGEIKDAIKDAMLDGIIPNNYDSAYEYMLKIGKEMGLSMAK